MTIKSTLARREKKLAFALLLPTFCLVIAIVLFPLFANFWISFKPVSLGDLRPPTIFVKERVKGELQKPGEDIIIEYRYRNSSMKYPLSEVSFTDILPQGIELSEIDTRCVVEKSSKIKKLTCILGEVEPKARGKILLNAFSNTLLEKNDFQESEVQSIFKSTNVLTSLDFTISNYLKVFSASEFFEVLKTTIYYTFFGTSGALLLGLFAAQIMQKAFPGRAFVRGILLFPYVAPVIAVAFSWVILFDPFSGSVNAMMLELGVVKEPINFFGQRYATIGLLGLEIKLPVALTMVIIFEIWRYFPLSFLFILARMQSIPSDLFEAAEMDGATPFQQFWFLSIPHIIGILGVLFLLRFIWTFNKFDDIFLLTGGNAGTRTLTVNVYEQAFAISNLGAGAAVAVIIFVFLLIFSILFIRYTPKDEG